MIQYVAYYRLSKESKNGFNLGIDAQKSTVDNFIKTNTGDLLCSFQEVESGKKDDRPQLLAAIAFAKEQGAKLLIAKLDRLSRNVSFVFALRDSGVNFVACDLPEANTLTIGIMAVFAQYERERISQRTKDALAAMKKSGRVKRCPNNITKQMIENSIATKKKNALSNENSRRAFNYARRLRFDDRLTLREVAKRLNKDTFVSPDGKTWHPETVRRLLKKKASMIDCTFTKQKSTDAKTFMDVLDYHSVTYKMEFKECSVENSQMQYVFKFSVDWQLLYEIGRTASEYERIYMLAEREKEAKRNSDKMNLPTDLLEFLQQNKKERL